MGEEILVNDQIEAGADFVRDFNDLFAVSLAFWVVPAETDSRYLYIASDDIDDSNFDVAYREVVRRLRGRRNPWLDPFQVRLVNSTEPIAVDAMRIRDQHLAPLGVRYGGSLGRMTIDAAYIYPPLSDMKVAP